MDTSCSPGWAEAVARPAERPSAAERRGHDALRVPPSRSKSPRSLSVRAGTALVVSFLLHLPLMPIVLAFGLLSRMERAREAASQDYLQNAPTIAVELLTEFPSVSSRPPTSSPPQTMEPMPPDAPRSGGEVPGSDALAEGGPEDGEGEATELATPSEEAGEEESLGTLEGEANVTMNLWMAPMREHALAPRLRTMLDCGKLGATLRRARLDAFSDVDAAVFAGPRLDDPAQYTAALSHHLAPLRLRTSLAYLTRPHGLWLDESSVRIHAAGATRIVYERGPSLVLATPESVWRKLKESERPMRMPIAKGRALSLTVREPAMAFRRLGLDLPASLTKMRLDAYPERGGGVDLRLRLEDRDEAAARQDREKIAKEIELALSELRQVTALSRVFASVLGTPSLDVELPRFRFTTEGSAVVAVARMNANQVDAMLAQLEPLVCEEGRGGRSRSRGTGSAR